jgi:hypothetical protein
MRLRCSDGGARGAAEAEEVAEEVVEQESEEVEEARRQSIAETRRAALRSQKFLGARLRAIEQLLSGE